MNSNNNAIVFMQKTPSWHEIAMQSARFLTFCMQIAIHQIPIHAIYVSTAPASRKWGEHPMGSAARQYKLTRDGGCSFINQA
jgi:hypothetical protein